jgi:hypothetical protein
MRITTRPAAVAALSLVVLACGDPTNPNANDPLRLTSEASAVRGNAQIQVSMMDACDPASFNAVLGDGACVRSGGVKFDKFLEQLAMHQRVGSWHFAPSSINAAEGQNIVARNRGGEVHTFTPVAEFGGGFVVDLNQLSGTPVPAPECLDFGSIVFVPPGGTVEETVGAAPLQHFQCCIHPWMRATARVR